MTVSSVVHSQAFRYLENISTGVDERTGLFVISVLLDKVPSHDLMGPGFSPKLTFNPMNTRNAGFGVGWDWLMTRFNLNNKILALSTGETYLWTSSLPDGTPLFEENTLDTFHLEKIDDEGNEAFRLAHKSGEIEILKPIGSGEGRQFVPHQIYDPSGRQIKLEHEALNGSPVLKSVSDDTRTLLLIERNPGGTVVSIKIHPYEGPSGGPRAVYTLNVNGEYLEKITLPTEDNAGWDIVYQDIHNIPCVMSVRSPIGAYETLEYLGEGHIVPGSPMRLPRVTRHKVDPGCDQPIIERVFEYYSTDDNRGHNFLGNGVATSITYGKDPTYRVSHTYNYGTTVRLMGDVEVNNTIVRQTVRTEINTFSRFHAQTEKKIIQNNCVKRQVTTYYAEDKPFESQPKQFLMSKTVTDSWQLADDSSAIREERSSTEFNVKGNLTAETQHNGIKTTYSFYPAEGGEGCPPDSEGFERNLKETIVEPAPGPEAPVLCTRMTYRDLKSMPGSASKGWLMPDRELLLELKNGKEIELQRIDNLYHEDTANKFLHGRASEQKLVLNDYTTRTEYEYSKPPLGLAAQPVLQTVVKVTGFDHMCEDDPEPRHVQKTNTLQHSLTQGLAVLTYDDNNVSILSEFDALSRVLRETVAPDSEDLKATRQYSYTLVSSRGGKARQTMTDVKGVTTNIDVDGLQRVVSESRQDADAVNAAGEFLRMYEATYNVFGDKVEESAYDWPNTHAAIRDDECWPNGQLPLKLTTRFEYDDWGELCCTTDPDGIRNVEEIDPVGEPQWRKGPVQRSWRQSTGDTPQNSGITVTYLNAFGKPESIKRFNAPGDTNAYSEHAYEYDGLGNTIKETDARHHVTEYTYDSHGRLNKTILPGGAVVERSYADYSSEELAVEIKVNQEIFGTQLFDGLGRMVSLTTGGRLQVFSYEQGQTQPASVTTALGTIRYRYDPRLVEDPIFRYLPGETGEVAAEYDYDKKNARLTTCQEGNLRLDREYYSNGEVKKETRVQDGVPYTMLYGTSHLGRQVRYTDVLGNVQQYLYDLAGRLVYTELGTTQSRFYYDDLGRTKQIATCDGDQTVTITMDFDPFERERTRTFKLNDVEQVLTQDYNEVDALVVRVLKEGAEVLRNEECGYDPRNRLTTYRCSGSQPPIDPYGNAITAQTFRFDAKDNITQVLTTFAGGSNLATYSYENTDPVQLSKVTNSNPAANYPAVINLEYDGNGNLVKDEQGRALEYDALNRLLSVSALPGDKDASYRYDPLNVLAGSDVEGHQEQRFYQNDELASLINGSNSSSFMRGDGVVLAERQAGDDPKFLMLAVDQKNTVTNEVNDGAFTNIAYSAYGYSSAGQPVKAQLGYNGEFTERKTGLQLLGNGYRAYSSVLMKFHSPDDESPDGKGGKNWYAYCEGDPIQYSDSSGHYRFFHWLAKRLHLTSKHASRNTYKDGKKTVTNNSNNVGVRNAAPLNENSREPSVAARPAQKPISQADFDYTVKMIERGDPWDPRNEHNVLGYRTGAIEELPPSPPPLVERLRLLLKAISY